VLTRFSVGRWKPRSAWLGRLEAGPFQPVDARAEKSFRDLWTRRRERSAKTMERTSTKPMAVVIGASSGIGFELAKVFGENGYDLLIAAEDDELVEAGRELQIEFSAVSSNGKSMRPTPKSLPSS
jgi:hypothetical protein